MNTTKPTLAEIEKAIAAQDTLNTLERAKWADHYGTGHDIHREWIDYLKLLLPVVKAAKAYDKVRDQVRWDDCTSEWWHTHEALHDALKAFED